jgi:AICAR transformylase/IMP cyclohydrolase PurH
MYHDAYHKAYLADSFQSLVELVAINGVVDKKTAEEMSEDLP